MPEAFRPITIKGLTIQFDARIAANDTDGAKDAARQIVTAINECLGKRFGDSQPQVFGGDDISAADIEIGKVEEDSLDEPAEPGPAPVVDTTGMPDDVAAHEHARIICTPEWLQGRMVWSRDCGGHQVRGAVVSVTQSESNVGFHDYIVLWEDTTRARLSTATLHIPSEQFPLPLNRHHDATVKGEAIWLI